MGFLENCHYGKLSSEIIRRIGYVIPPCVQRLFIKKRLNEDNRLKTRLMLFDLIVLNPGKPA